MGGNGYFYCFANWGTRGTALAEAEGFSGVTPIVPVTPSRSGEPDVLAPRPFRPLPQIERDRLPFTKFIEGRLTAGGIVEEVLGAVARDDETEALFADEPLDRAVH